ncbi:MAG TPA: hypothetical protein VHB79_26520 [Polyangiaceae bacterium]|nr:hypothetical protein [Polyangiaceae bacterium]
MQHPELLEMLADAGGSVSFGWADPGVFYARFSHTLSARTGKAFAARLNSTARIGKRFKYFADAYALESYDLLARSAFVRVVNEHRRLFEQIHILAWQDGEVSPALLSALGQPVSVTHDPIEFEARLLGAAPRARTVLAAKPDSPHRTRWPLRR